jgi:hypothetical protein
VARTEKNFDVRSMQCSSEGGIPSLWSGCLDRALALLKAPGLWIIEKLNCERKSDQHAC